MLCIAHSLRSCACMCVFKCSATYTRFARVCVCVCRMKQIIFILLIALARSSGWNCCGSASVVEPEAIDRVGYLRKGPDRAGRPGQYVISPISTPTPTRGMPFIRVPALNGPGSGIILYILSASTPANSVISEDESDE